MKLLIVDDVQEYLNSLCRALQSEHEIVTAASLDEAKQKMSADVKLALIDIRLSEEDAANRDGIILLGWLKENFPSVPVVMMSAYRDFDAAADAMNLGAKYFLKKPINLQELREAIRASIRQ
jgi:DNA-binding NtrC family response regulator